MEDKAEISFIDERDVLFVKYAKAHKTKGTGDHEVESDSDSESEKSSKKAVKQNSKESEFIALVNTTTTPDVEVLSQELLASLEKLSPRLLQMGEVLVNSEHVRELYTLLFQSFEKQCLTIYRRKEIKFADKKAELCASWMRYLDNFKPGRNTEERKLLEKVFKVEFSAQEIHSVSKELHSQVYNSVHANVHEKKKEEFLSKTDVNVDSTSKECIEKIYCFAGASLNRMKSTRSKSLAGKGSEVRQSRLKTVEAELCLLESLTLQNKEPVKRQSTFLRELDIAKDSQRGGLTMPAQELKPFLRELDNKVRQQINEKAQKRYGNQMLKIAESSLLSDLELERSFSECVDALRPQSSTPDLVKSLCKELIKKYLHAREGEYKQALEELSMTKTGAVVTASQNLRDTLKTYSISEKRKR